jgi:hypothetical protein
MSWAVVLWSAGLAVVAAFNLLWWARAALRFRLLAPTLADAVCRTRALQLWLSAAYVLGCAYRSLVPVYDVPRVAMLDSPLASVLVGRSVATVAELCFVAQWALTLREASHITGSTFGRRSSRLVLPMIVVAELCSWYSVLTTSNLGHAFEETLWALSAALMVTSLLVAWPCWKPLHRPAVVVLSTIGVAYVLYMLLVDIPLYANRWLMDEAAGRRYLGLGEGLRDILYPHAVTHAFEAWRHELVWMALYFSAGVWISIGLVHSPLPQRRPLPGRVARPWLRLPRARTAGLLRR